MAFQLHKTVVLVGMMGAGKSAVGTALARKIGVEIRDSDSEIEIAANMRIGEIFDRDGEAFFRQREAEVVRRLLRGPPGILSTGGGAFLLERNRKTISQFGLSIWLQADFELLWSRVRNKTTRPLLLTDNPRETLRELCDIREKSYQLADMKVVAKPEYSIEDMCDVVTAALLTRNDVLVEN